MKSLLNNITERAINTFYGPHENIKDGEVGVYNSSGFGKRWFNHWIATANEMKAEFLQEGLVQTAEKVQENIDFELKWNKGYFFKKGD